MNILYITTVPSPYKVEMFEELGKLCNLTVLFEKRSVSYRNEGWMVNKYNNFHAEFIKGFSFKDKMFSLGIIKHLKRNKYDLVIIGVYSTVSQMLAQEYMKKNKIPYVISSDGGIIKSENSFVRKIKKHFIGSAKAWLSTGDLTNDYLINYGAKRERIYVYPFTSILKKDVVGKSISLEEKYKLRKKLNMPEDKIILSVGQFIHRKGYDILMKACKDLDKRIGVYIVGGKPTNEYIELKKEMNLTNIHFIDFMKKDALGEYYKAADLFVLPTREDIWGLVINEAVAYGLPIISTDKCVAAVELNRSKCIGEIVPSEDVAALHNAIKKMFNNSAIKDICENVVDAAKEYTIENSAYIQYKIFEKIINNR